MTSKLHDPVLSDINCFASAKPRQEADTDLPQCPLKSDFESNRLILQISVLGASTATLLRNSEDYGIKDSIRSLNIGQTSKHVVMIPVAANLFGHNYSVVNLFGQFIRS